MARIHQTDRALGLQVPINRRDFLDGVLLTTLGTWSADAAPATLLAGPTSISKTQSRWGGNPDDVIAVGHAIRDGKYDRADLAAEAIDSIYDLVIVGGGFSGLAAAYYCRQGRAGWPRILVLENHDHPGGAARSDAFSVGGVTLHAAQGSIVAQQPTLGSNPPSQL